MVDATEILAIDIGGTKTLVALVNSSGVVAEMTVPTKREDGPDGWLEAAFAAAQPWQGRFHGIGVAVTGIVRDGRWSAMNPATLGIPPDYPLVARVKMLFSQPAIAVNDAQAAAWGEHAFGAGQRENLAFLTISTGIGGTGGCWKAWPVISGKRRTATMPLSLKTAYPAAGWLQRLGAKDMMRMRANCSAAHRQERNGR